MLASLFASLFCNLIVSDVQAVSQTLSISAQSSATSAICPHCGQTSSSVHSSYTRTPHDLPLSDYAVRLILHVRRFRCRNSACPATTFAERPTELLQPYAQRTVRLQQALQHLGLAFGGMAGAKTSQHLHMVSRHDTILRLIHQLPQPVVKTPRVLGIDDFAFCKGQRYGTILVDLERRCPIDILPERSAATLATWLEQHPGVEVIARDRGPEYIRGATIGAPQAIQVADRFHLPSNLREALERTLERAHTSLRTRLASAVHAGDATPQIGIAPVRRRMRAGSEATLPSVRRERRLALYEAVHALHQQGKSRRHIADELGLSRWLVRRFVEAEVFPERAPNAPRATILAPFQAILSEQWAKGERTTATLFQHVQAAGFMGSISTVRQWVQQRRQVPAPHTQAAHRARYTVAPHEVAQRVASQRRLPSARHLVWLLLGTGETCTCENHSLLGILLQEPRIATSYVLAQHFLQIVRQRDHVAFDTWLADCARSDVIDRTNFASGLQQDRAAVRAALTLPWSSGQVEGQVNRLKLLKRQMYGRAGFDLLRLRVLYSPKSCCTEAA